jgi:23S rRNA (uracil1939-C5)-methyltransferase
VSATLPCPVQAECGGCGLMPLRLAAQHDLKVQRLRAALEQHGLATNPLAVSPSPRALGYRNRIRLRIDSSGVIHFFNQDKPPSCAVLEPKLRERLEALLELSRETPRLFSAFSHLELRSDDALGRAGLALGGTHPEVAALLEPALKLASVLNTTLVGVRGDPEIVAQQRRIVDGVMAWVPLDAFWQINSEVNSLLVTALRAGAAQRGLSTLLDLYAGAGTFAIPLAAAGASVCAVEIHAPAVRALSAAVAAQGWVCEAYAEPARAACERLQAEGRTFQLVLLDAPRAGAREVVAIAAKLSSHSVVVCSCNVDTLARDLAAFRAEGFELEELRAFDMFPHTHHLEALAWLTRSSR